VGCIVRNFGLTGPDGNISAAADNRLTGVVGNRNDKRRG
jgi:hypothetical protein